MSKSSKLDKTAKVYIINSIDGDAYGNDCETIDEKIAFLKECFTSEYGWRVNQVGEQQAMIDWLQGLPSVIHIAFYNFDILELAREWGSLATDASEKAEDKILDNYWNFMAAKTCQLFRGYDVPKSL